MLAAQAMATPSARVFRTADAREERYAELASLATRYGALALLMKNKKCGPHSRAAKLIFNGGTPLRHPLGSVPRDRAVVTIFR